MTGNARTVYRGAAMPTGGSFAPPCFIVINMLKVGSPAGCFAAKL